MRSTETSLWGFCAVVGIFSGAVLQGCYPAGSDPADFVESLASIRPGMSYDHIVTAVPAYYFDSPLEKRHRMLTGSYSSTSNDTCSYLICLRRPYFLFPDGYTAFVHFDAQTNVVGMYYGAQPDQRFADWRPDWGVVVGR